MNKPQGLTLTELLLTITVLGILMAVAIPSYHRHIKNTRLNEAYTLLLKNTHAMEQFYQQNRSFKQNSTTWPQLPYTATGHFCIRPQGNPRGALSDKFTLKAVALDKNNEPRVLKINESLIATICESSTSTCEEQSKFFRGGSTVDKKCRLYR